MSNKRYEVRIIEHTIETQICGKDWKPIRSVEPSEYAYTPEIEKQVEVTREIYSQHVDDLNLVSVIKAVNNVKVTP